jgi:hypothetical protein
VTADRRTAEIPHQRRCETQCRQPEPVGGQPGAV